MLAQVSALLLSRSLFITVLLAIACGAYAQSTLVVVSDEEQIQEVGYRASYFFDVSKKLGVSDVSARNFQSSFKKHRFRVPEFSGQDGRAWIKINILNSSSQEVYLHFATIYLEYIHVYFPDSVGGFLMKSTGYRYPYNTRELDFSNSYAIKIPFIEKGQPYTIYASTETMGPHIVSINAGTRTGLQRWYRGYEFVAAAVVGALLVIFVFNLFIYFIIRDRLYLYYLFYLIAALSYVLFFFGYLFEWVWPDVAVANRYPWPVGLSLFSILLLANRWLEVKKKLPSIYKFGYFSYALSLIIMFGFLVPQIGRFMVVIVNINTIALPAYLMVVCIMLWKDKSNQPKLFLLGWVPFMIIMALFLILPRINMFNQLFVDHGISFAIVWEMSVFALALALGYRYNTIRQEKLKIQEENMQLIHEQNKMLEQKVRERTEEISAQNEELMVQQEELSKSRKLLELEVLKTQVHPHFLFNTLNNLYGMITQNPAKGATLMVDLSDLMRHLIISSQYKFCTPKGRDLVYTKLHDT